MFHLFLHIVSFHRILILVFFCRSLAFWSQCCVVGIIFYLGLMNSFCVACFICLQAMSASTLVWSQLPWHWEGLVCLIVLSFWLRPTICLPKCKLVPIHACEFTCNFTKLLAFEVALGCKIFWFFDWNFQFLPLNLHQTWKLCCHKIS
jgi:hypothetical protein